MTKYQFRSVMAVLWLIAAHTTDHPGLSLVCTVFFAFFSVGILFVKTEHVRSKP